METRKLAVQIVKISLFIVLIVSLGVYSSIRNAEDDIFQDLQLPEIREEVQVYRDKYGVPTILANHIRDLALVQGYEFARDRAFQLEFYHAMINGELADIFGIDYLEIDILIRTLNFKYIGQRAESNLDIFYQEIISSYVEGINLFFDHHEFNLPWEFQLLGIVPSNWEVSDSLAMQAVLSYFFNFESFANELKRLEVINQVGMSKALELYPPVSQKIEGVLLNSNSSYNELISLYDDPLSKIFENQDFQSMTANSWIMSGSMTTSGLPIIANSINMRFGNPSFWYQVNLQLADNSLNVQGYSIPGLPLILVGHNQNLGWSIGESDIDSVDLMFFESNQTHYYHNGTWKNFIVETHEFSIEDVPNIERRIFKTEMGPILNVSDGWYAVKWTLLENNSRDLMFQGLFQLNIASSIEGAHRALQFFSSPSLNFLLVHTNGNIASQTAGLIPVRESGQGMIPENGSIYSKGWTQYWTYESMNYYNETSKDYLVNGVGRTRNKTVTYVYEINRPSYQADRIDSILNNTNPNGKLSIADSVEIQSDIFNTAAYDIFSLILDQLTLQINLLSIEELIPLILVLNDWNYLMDVDSIGATIAETFLIFYTQDVFADELGTEITNKIIKHSIVNIGSFITNGSNTLWFDDTSTSNETESMIDVALSALNKTNIYLTDNLGKDIENWKWGKIHQITYRHVIGESVPFFGGLNHGPTRINGSSYTVLAFPDTSFVSEGVINFDSFYGSSIQIIAEVSISWDQVVGIQSPGVSSNFLSEHYDDGYDDWVKQTYRPWMFNPLEIVLTQELSITYSHGDENG